ncbi:MAG: helix-turn-helix domain-containing protein [candidate division Zixibacteria bacterium]|nr:helix-turn-helix domain-containing protein [candidate division Zixibacteria bacterium]
MAGRSLPVRWLDKAEAAIYLGVSIHTLNEYITHRRIPHHKMPGSIFVRFDIHELDDWIASGRIRTASEELHELKRRGDGGLSKEAS